MSQFSILLFLRSLRREVDALQAENYSLEKEMHVYQQSIATKCSSSINSQAPSLVGFKFASSPCITPFLHI